MSLERLETEDFRALSHLGRALWADPGDSTRAALETLTAVSLQEIPAEKMLERASSALLLRAERDGPRAIALQLNDPFYRLSAPERLVLVSLHFGQWSYRRLGRVLGVSPEQVAELAWGARTTLALEISARRGKKVMLPAGSSGPRCPVFELRRPWSQTFLDEEVAPQERMFLQNHLMVCKPCQGMLARTRDLYFLVESILPRDTDAEEVAALQNQFSKMYRLNHLHELTFKESLQVFLSRESTKWLFSLLTVVFLLFLIARSI